MSISNENSESFETILKAAELELTLQYYYSKPDNVYALIKFGKSPPYRSKIINYIKNGFDILRKTAQDEKEKVVAEMDKYPESYSEGYVPKEFINHVIFGALARTAGMLMENELAEIIYNEFLYAGRKESFYELNLETGTLAIALSALDYEGELEKFQDVLNLFERISGDAVYVLEMHYALWMLKKDKIKPLEYLKDATKTKNLSLVATTLADLDVKKSLPILKEKLIQIKNPITQEVFLEAIYRLEQQKEAPTTLNRMIWLYGKVTSTEMAGGYETDNEFILRAIKKTKNEDGAVYEVDDFLNEFNIEDI